MAVFKRWKCDTPLFEQHPRLFRFLIINDACRSLIVWNYPFSELSATTILKFQHFNFNSVFNYFEMLE